MRQLKKKGVLFKNSANWTLDLKEEFQKLKAEICSVFENKPFDSRRGVHFYNNASKEGGRGYMVPQEEGEWTENGEFQKEITCGSTSLTLAQ